MTEDEKIWLPKVMQIAGFSKSTSEALRLIKQGGVSVNDEKWSDPKKELPDKFLLKVGKRKFIKIKFTKT